MQNIIYVWFTIWQISSNMKSSLGVSGKEGSQGIYETWFKRNQDAVVAGWREGTSLWKAGERSGPQKIHSSPRENRIY